LQENRQLKYNSYCWRGAENN